LGIALRTAALAAGEIRSLALRGFQLALLLDAVVPIHLKRAAGRPKDLERIAELEALQEERTKR